MQESYVLMSAARNEELYIEQTINSVLSQSLKPKRWVIVSDGSTDRTDEIVSYHAARNSFIELVRVEGKQERHFASKVAALRVAYSRLEDLEFDFIGNLDVDITLEPEYYAKLIKKFDANVRLGITGGLILNPGPPQFLDTRVNLDSVRGPIQFFRRRCFEEIGGFVPLVLGGEDAVAETMARMKGWEVRTFPDVKGVHLRETGTAGKTIKTARMLAGARDYCLGYHPLFFCLKTVHRCLERPYVLGGFLMLIGYWRAWMTKTPSPLSNDFVAYLRSEQISRMRSALNRLISLRLSPQAGARVI